MAKTNSISILNTTTLLYARSGYCDFSIRKIAKELSISPSVIYHYYETEEKLLSTMFDYNNTLLGNERSQLPIPNSALKMLKQRIEFQIDHIDKIVAVLKYYLAHRNNFPKNTRGFIPDKSSLHIEEVLEYGKKTNEFNIQNIKDDAKIITHAINGFLLEYYPYKLELKERKQLVDKIYKFLVRALKGGDINGK
jgi:AcrR family transcriptional regulator